MIAESIVKSIGAMEPSGRFLAKDAKRGGLWYSIGSDRAREKASQALRENSQRVREEIEQETMQKHAEDSLPPVPSLQQRHYPHMDHHHAPGAYSYGMPHPHHGHHHPAPMAPGPAPGWGYAYYPPHAGNGSGGQEQPEQHPSAGTHHVYSVFPSASALGYGMAHSLNTGPPLPSIPVQYHDHRVPCEEPQEGTAVAPAPYHPKNSNYGQEERRAASESDELLLSAAESWPLVAHAVSMSPITKSKQYATLTTQESNDASMATPAQDKFMQGLQQIYSATSFDPIGTSFSNEQMYPAEDSLEQQTRGTNMYDGETPRETYQSKRRLSLSYVAKEEAVMYPKAPKLRDSYEEQDPTEPLDLNMASPSSPHPSMLQQPIFLEQQQGNSNQHQHVCSLTPVGASCFSALEDMLRYVGSSSGGDNNMECGSFGGYPTNVSTTALAGDGSFSDSSRRGSIGDDTSELRDSPVMYSPRAA